MGKGTSSTTTNSNAVSSTAPDSNAYQAYLALLNRAGGVASTPYQAYGGEETAPINEQQTAGVGAINNAQGAITASGAPISAADIARYQDPYTNQVIDATQKDFDAQNERAGSVTQGNAASQGALGGDRSAVAAALTQEGQTRAQAPIIAGLRSQGYQSAVKTAEDQQQQALRAGVAGSQSGQTMFGAGTAEQQTQQAKDTQGRMDYYQAQGYPFQVAQWLASIDTGVGSQMGGTGTNTGTSVTQGPTPNPWTQVGGLALAGASMFANRGGRVSGVHRYADGGGIRLSDDEMHAFHEWKAKHYPEERTAGVHGYAGGGSPWGNDQTWIPQVGGISAGKGAPGAPSLPSAPSAPQQKGLSTDQMKGIGTLGKSAYGGIDKWLNGDPGSFSSPMDGLTSADYDPAGAGVFARGGPVRRGYAVGGSPDDDPTFDERFDAAYHPRMAAGVGAARPAFAEEEPFRMPPKEAVEAWRAGVDRDTGVGQSAQDSGPLPPEVISGRSKPAPEPAEDDAEGPSGAMAYDAAPRVIRGVGPAAASPDAPQDDGLLSRLGIKMTPEMRQGLLQAGLSMMATRHGGPGSFLSAAGEAGMAGVGAYSQSQQLAVAQAEKARKEAFEREKFEAPFSRQTAAQLETARHNKAQEAKELKPEYKVIRKEIDPDTGQVREIMGWVDPNTKKVTEEPGQAAKPAATASTDSSVVDYSRNAPRIDRGADLPEPKALAGKSSASIKSDAEYYAQTGKLPPVRAGQSPVAVMQQSYRNAVQNYGNALAESRGINPSQLAELWRTAPGQLRFVLGADGRATVSLGTAVRHLDTMRELAAAWGANDTQGINRVRAAIAKQFGGADATNLEAAGKIIGPEIVKAIGVAGAGTAEERKAVESAFSTAASPAQMLGAIRTTQALLGGQLEGRKRQAAAAGVSEDKFKSLIGDRPYEILTSSERGHKPEKKELSAADKQAADWAAANPNDPRAAKIKERLGAQ